MDTLVKIIPLTKEDEKRLQEIRRIVKEKMKKTADILKNRCKKDDI